MDRCRRRLPPRHKQLLSTHLLPVTMLMFFLAHETRSDTVNILRGGNFRDSVVEFQGYPMQDVLANGLKSLLPYWTCVHGGIQLWDTRIYISQPSDNTNFIVHMNSRKGSGHMISTPMYTPRENAEYMVSMSLACNPHGGPRNQSLMAVVFDNEGKEMQPRPNPFILNSNPNSSMENLNWERVSFKMLGTGKCMYLYLASMVKGYYGLLVANVQVNLINLLDNGSFEALTLASTDTFDNVTMDLVLEAPRPTVIPNWVVQSGKIRLIMTGPNEAFQAASDGGQYCVELNANGSKGEISTTFGVPMNTSVSKDHEYVLLFDTAANPIQPPPQTVESGVSPFTLVGRLGIKVIGMPSGKVLLNKDCEMNSTGFAPFSVGWKTRTYSFNMGQDKTAKVLFTSLVEGSYGPLVDNIGIYEVKDKREWIKENSHDYVSSGANKQMPTMFTTKRQIVFILTTFLLLIFLQ